MKNWLQRIARWIAPVTEQDVVEFLDARTDGPLKDYGTIGRYRFFLTKK